MPDDIETRIRTYAALIESEAAPVTADEVAERAGDGAAGVLRRPEHSRLSWRVGIAAAAAAILVIGLPAFFLLGGDGTPAPTPPSTIPVSTDGPEWTPSGRPPDLAILESLWSGPEGTVFAYGDGVIWTTDDGELWTRDGEVGVRIWSTPSSPKLVSFGGGFVAVDTSQPDWWGLSPEERAGAAARVLVSGDGEEWSTIDLPFEPPSAAPALQYEAHAEAVAAGPLGIVVVGRAEPRVDPAAVEAAFPELGSVVRIAELPPCCEDGGPLQTDVDEPLWVTTAAGSEPVAISLTELGLTEGDLRNRVTLTWYSAEGEAFEPVDSGLEGGMEFEVLATPDGFVLAEPFSQTTRTSPDGLSWSSGARLPDGCNGLAVWKSRIVCLGETETGSGVLQLEPDGSWSVVADTSAFGLPDGVFPAGLAAGDLGLAVIGTAEEPESEGGEPIPTGRAVAFSTDGLIWSMQTLDSVFGGAGAIEIAMTGERLIGAHGPAPDGWMPGWEVVDPAWWTAIPGN
jgi:hypothetical protein